MTICVVFYVHSTSFLIKLRYYILNFVFNPTYVFCDKYFLQTKFKEVKKTLINFFILRKRKKKNNKSHAYALF